MPSNKLAVSALGHQRSAANRTELAAGEPEVGRRDDGLIPLADIVAAILPRLGEPFDDADAESEGAA